MASKNLYPDAEIEEDVEQRKLMGGNGNQVRLQSDTPITDQSEVENKKYTLERRRWCQLLNMCLAIMLNQVAWISMSTIGNQLADVYDVSVTTVNLLPMMFQIVFVVLSIPGTRFIETKGQHWAVLLGTICNTTGMVIKVFINVNFYICFVGQLLPAFASILIVNSITRVAAVWFGQNERVTAISLMVACQATGVALGFVLPVIFFSDDMPKEDFKHNAEYFLGSQAALGIFNLLLSVCIFKSKPDTPPSMAIELEEAQQNEPDQEQSSQIKNWCEVATNVDFILLSIVFGLLQAGQNALGAVVGEIVAAYGFTSDNASIFGAVFITGGVSGSIILGIILEKTQAYKKVLVSISLLSAVSAVVLCLTVKMSNIAVVSILCFTIGFGMISVSVPAFDFGVELTYPLNESYSTTWLNIVGNLLTVIITALDTHFIDTSDYPHTGDKSGSFYCFVVEPIIAGVALILAIIMRQKLKRSDAEKKQKQAGDANGDKTGSSEIK